MRKILIAVGSGLAIGNTHRLAMSFAEGAKAAGHEVRFVFLGDKTISGCRGCGACQISNRCVIKDDMQPLYSLFDWCDTMVLASPLYFWTVSAQLKTFLDRMYAVSRSDIYPHRGTIFLMTSGDNSENTFRHAGDFLDVIADVYGNKCLARYFAGGCKGGHEGHVISDHHLKNAYNLGFNLK